MFAEHFEYTSILVSQMLFDTVTNSYATTAKTKLATHFCVNADIQLSYMNMLYDFLIQGDSIIYLFLCRTVDIVVTLHTNTINGHTSLLHGLHHVVDALALYWITFIIVVIEQQGFGVCLTSILESFSNELITSNLIEL